MSPPRTDRLDLLRVLTRRRRVLAAGLLALAIATALPVLAPGDPPGVAVLTAARDLDAGVVVGPEDLATVRLPPGAVPSGTLTSGQVQGRVLAGPVRRGEPLTDVRLVGPALLTEMGEDLVAAAVRLADPAAALLVRSGDVVDVLAASTGGDAPTYAEVVAAAARVLVVPEVVPQAGGALVVVAVAPRTAARLAASAVTSRLSVVLRT